MTAVIALITSIALITCKVVISVVHVHYVHYVYYLHMHTMYIMYTMYTMYTTCTELTEEQWTGRSEDESGVDDEGGRSCANRWARKVPHDHDSISHAIIACHMKHIT